MELNEIVQVLSNSLKEANKQISERSKNEIGFAAVDFSISFPAEFKVEKSRTVLNFVDLKSQVVSTSAESAQKGSTKESSNTAMITIRFKPIPE